LLPTDICNFIGYLFEKQYSSSSIASHISALGYVHKLLNVPDPTQTFIVRKLLKGCHKLLPSQDSRLPITKNIMQKILAALVFTVPQALNRVLLQSLFLLCFNAFLRLGEVITKSAADKDTVVQVQDVIFNGEKSKPVSVQIVLSHHKSQQKNEPIIISIQANSTSQFCPVQYLCRYKSLFPHVSGPFFQFVDGTPVTYSYVNSELSKAIAFAGLDPKRYKGHSFRIGAATHAAQLGYSEALIQHLGRWKSNVLHRYIRIRSFQF
jgi:integrase